MPFQSLLIIVARPLAALRRAGLRPILGALLSVWLLLPMAVSAGESDLSAPASASALSSDSNTATDTNAPSSTCLVKALAAAADLDAEYPPTPRFAPALAHHFGHAPPRPACSSGHLNPDPRGLLRPPDA